MNANADADTTSGDCAAGTGDDTIVLPAGTYTLTIAGTADDANATGDLDITDTDGLTISGAGADTTIIQAGTTSPVSGVCGDCVDRVMEVRTGAPLDLEGVTLRHGEVAGDGGCLYAFDAGVVTLTGVTVTDNKITGGEGSGVYKRSSVTGSDPLIIRRSAIVNNSGRALYVNRVDATLENVTVSGNSGGGSHFTRTTTTITNSAFVLNSGGSRGGTSLGTSPTAPVPTTSSAWGRRRGGPPRRGRSPRKRYGPPARPPGGFISPAGSTTRRPSCGGRISSSTPRSRKGRPTL